MNNSVNKRALVVLVIILLLLVAGFFVYRQLTSYQNMSVNLSSRVTNPKIVVKQINTDNDVEEIEYTTLGSELRLKKGDYSINFSAEGYQEQDSEVTLANEPEVVTIKPSYSDEKLAELLEEQKTEITDAINQEFPQIRSDYRIDNGRLFMLGEWYGAEIRIKQTPQEERENYIDVYRIILKKNGENWEVVTKPPEIVISSPKYPDIPKEVLSEINKNPEPQM